MWCAQLYYLFGNACGSNLFNHYCRKQQIDIVIEIIKITIRIKRLINFTSRKTVIINNGTYYQSIMYKLTTCKDTHKKIICGVRNSKVQIALLTYRNQLCLLIRKCKLAIILKLI